MTPPNRETLADLICDHLEEHQGFTFEDCWSGGDNHSVRVTFPSGKRQPWPTAYDFVSWAIRTESKYHEIAIEDYISDLFEKWENATENNNT